MNRPILSISLLPHTWQQKNFKSLHNDLVHALGTIPELGIKSERDLFNLFPRDRMSYGADGSEVVVQMRIPMHRSSDKIRAEVKDKIEMVLEKHLPNLSHIEFAIDMPPAERP